MPENRSIHAYPVRTQNAGVPRSDAPNAVALLAAPASWDVHAEGRTSPAPAMTMMA